MNFRKHPNKVEHNSSAAGSAGGSGDVGGPNSSTDQAIAIFDGTSGKLLKNSPSVIADDGKIIPGNLTSEGRVLISDDEGGIVESVVTAATLEFLDIEESLQGLLDGIDDDLAAIANDITALQESDEDLAGDIAALSASLANYLPKAGGTMTGAIDMGSHLITSLLDPVSAQDAATKNYVDSLLLGLKWKNSVRVATTANGTLATAYENGDTVDGIVLATGNRILLKNQTSAIENGIYVVNASGAPTRATDFDTWSEIISAAVLVEEGNANADTNWSCTVNSGGTVGSNDITFAQFSGSSNPYTATMSSLSASAGTVANGDTLQQVIDKLVGNQLLWPAFSAYRSANQNFTTNNTEQKITFNATNFNIGSGFNTSTNRFVVPAGQDGVYVFECLTQFMATNIAGDYYGVHYWVNGTLRNRFFFDTLAAARSVSLTGVSEELQLVAGDYVEVYMFGFANNSGSAYTMYGGATDGSVFSGRRVR